jgi:polyhydroxybutyrate depolymerase
MPASATPGSGADTPVSGVPAAAPAAGATTEGEVVMSPGCNGAALAAGDETRSVSVGGTMRSYIVHIPAGYDASRPVALVLNFHGLTSNNGRQLEYTNMNAKADEKGFIVAYPSGIDASFNAGNCCSDNAQDDVGFARSIIDEVGSTACLDLRRVYSTGLSNGGMMSFRLGCEASDVFAAIAPVVAFVAVDECTPPRGVPMLSFIGDADSVVTYDRAYPTNIDWAMINECQGDAVIEEHDASHCEVWSNCKDGVEVKVCVLAGMGHCWPGAPMMCRFGTANDDISANDAMWEFFERYRLPAQP